LKVPVLDGTLAQYRQFLPTPSPTGSSATPKGSAPSGTGTPSGASTSR
jgi:hypothetical protein